MEQPATLKRKPLFSAISLACMLIGVLLARMVTGRLEQGEVLGGYGSLGISLSFLVALLLSGLVTSQIGLIRGEKPLALPLLALLTNGLIFIAVIVLIPR